MNDELLEKLGFNIPDSKKIRIIIDTDAACEADDPFAIVQGLLSPKLIVKAILAEHFNQPGSVKRSFDEVKTILKCMNLEVPVFLGEEGPIDEKTEEISKGSEFIIKEALSNDENPLFILCQGAITNVASAIRKCPEIIDKMTVIWIGTHGDEIKKAPFREFNSGNDIYSANYVLSSGVDLWLVPSGVYTTVTVGIAELVKKVYPCGDIGKHLVNNMIQYNLSKEASWTQGESWSLGDSPAIALAINPGAGHFHFAKAPVIGDDTSTIVADNSENLSRPIVKIYDDIDARYVLEDFFAKLELVYGE